ncbi:g1276 [Coccomyxa elongata]
MGNGSRSHHLLKHALPEVDVKEHFGSIEPKEITREINRLGQRDLQAKFRAVYGTQTFSNNNNWLRRKLLEAAGLQTPKATARGRPSAKQARTLSSGDALGEDSPTVSQDDSFESHDGALRPPSPIPSVIRRTKRARKPKQFDDMLVMNQGHSQAVSDDDDNGHRHKISTSSATFSRRELHECTLLPCNSGTLASTEDLMWCPTGTNGYRAGHIIARAPSTPELPLARRQLVAFPGACSAAGMLLGAADVLGPAGANDGEDLSLPQWARLPSNDRSASSDLGDLEDTSAQDSRSTASPDPSGFEAVPYECALAPPTPPRLVSSASAASVSLLHDSPFAAAFGHGLVVSTATTANPGTKFLPYSGPADFDCFALAPPQPTPGAADVTPGVFDGKSLQALGMADSCASEMSVLDIFLEELSSQQELTHDLTQLAPLEAMWDIDVVV